MSAFRLPRLPGNVRLVDKAGAALMVFIRWWQSVMEKIEAQEASQDDLIQALADAVAAIADAQAAADAANAAAAAADAAASDAQTAADDAAAAAIAADAAAAQAAADQSLASSGVTGATLTATDAGSNATVTISSHTRLYGDGTSVSVTGGSVTALAYSTLYFVYYDQASRAGGSVTYAATTSQTTAAQTGDRHLVGQVTTPAALGVDIGGFYVGVAGIGGIYF